MDLITVLIGNKCFEIFQQQLSVNVRFGRDRFDGYEIPVFDNFPIIMLSASPRLELTKGFAMLTNFSKKSKFILYNIKNVTRK